MKHAAKNVTQVMLSLPPIVVHGVEHTHIPTYKFVLVRLCCFIASTPEAPATLHIATGVLVGVPLSAACML